MGAQILLAENDLTVPAKLYAQYNNYSRDHVQRDAVEFVERVVVGNIHNCIPV